LVGPEVVLNCGEVHGLLDYFSVVGNSHGYYVDRLSEGP
jgi:hypothetical protein